MVGVPFGGGPAEGVDDDQHDPRPAPVELAEDARVEAGAALACQQADDGRRDAGE